jgi:hypothetical protein
MTPVLDARHKSIPSSQREKFKGRAEDCKELWGEKEVAPMPSDSGATRVLE